MALPMNYIDAECGRADAKFGASATLVFCGWVKKNADDALLVLSEDRKKILDYNNVFVVVGIYIVC